MVVVVTTYVDAGVGTDRHPQAALIAEGAKVAEAVLEASDIDTELVKEDALSVSPELGEFPDVMGVDDDDPEVLVTVEVTSGEDMALPLRSSVDVYPVIRLSEIGTAVV
ncbi:hypothetical protein FH972_024886 [Carpinus fangiana]|uniref:Uncharacterized protein n=1 Tax=Carpinus fangiana TaxID=176857 RepID=A0A5N6KZE9_9ROSI|nr:hypothetical protein FH972_024886 [Carpinus fangiana]